MRIQAIREKVNIYAINRMLFGKVSPSPETDQQQFPKNSTT